MKRSGAGGFSMVELLLAIALAAIVATAACAALGLFVELDSRSIEHGERAIDVDRALRLLRQDVASATAIDLQTDQWRFTRRDGSVVVYALPAGGTELHRLTASALISLLLPLQTLLLGATPVEYDARGHLRDATYRTSAVLQGVSGISATAIRAALDAAPIGILVHVTHASSGGSVVTSSAAISLQLAEQHAKP